MAVNKWRPIALWLTCSVKMHIGEEKHDCNGKSIYMTNNLPHYYFDSHKYRIGTPDFNVG
jgi:hypothetical protein